MKRQNKESKAKGLMQATQWKDTRRTKGRKSKSQRIIHKGLEQIWIRWKRKRIYIYKKDNKIQRH
jgi:hypothetical protein